MKAGCIAALFALSVPTASAHRLDEYLQATLVSVDKNRLNAQMTLTPGVAVFAAVIAQIDTDRDGVISETERRAYGERVLRDLSITSDTAYLTPRLLSIRFPTLDEMKEGRGEIQLDFAADLPPGGHRRRLTIENRHENRISAYLVNCLVPQDPAIQISSQSRNYSQSVYNLEYEESGDAAAAPILSRWPGGIMWLGPLAFLLFARFVFLHRRHAARSTA